MPIGSGTAFVVRRSDGLLLTNAHVVDGCGRLALASGANATVVARDNRRDLALVRAEGSFEAQARFRRDQTVDLGETVGVATPDRKVGEQFVVGVRVNTGSLMLGSYDLSLRLNMSVNNAFDKKPPEVGNTIGTTTTNSGNTFPQNYDAIGRYWSVGANLKF